jgi:hypothetical protein
MKIYCSGGAGLISIKCNLCRVPMAVGSPRDPAPIIGNQHGMKHMQHRSTADEQACVCAGFCRFMKQFQRRRLSGSLSDAPSPEDLRLRFCCNAQ